MIEFKLYQVNIVTNNVIVPNQSQQGNKLLISTFDLRAKGCSVKAWGWENPSNHPAAD